MASTNKTTNYELSQYVGTDKPTYLSDYNGDMYKIDAQMKTNADNISTAMSSISTVTSTANTALSTAQSAESTANSASSTASSASTTAGNAQSTANSALSTATTAQSTANQVATDLNTFENKFNFTDFEEYGTDDVTATYCTYGGTLKVATNSDGSIGKIYGRVVLTGTSSGNNPTFSFTSNLRPTSEITINSLGIVAPEVSGAQRPLDIMNVTIATNGTVTVSSNYSGTGGVNGAVYRVMFFPCVLFMTDFGDIPE